MKWKEKIKRLIPNKRKLMQLYFALLFNANIKGFVSGNIYQGNTKLACVPGLNCYSCPGAVGACPLGSLQGSFSAGKSTLFYVGGILLLYSVLFGRMICGWLCPFGLIQELVFRIKTPKLKKSPITRLLSFGKYLILGIFVFLIPILYALKDTPLPSFCKYICPAGTLEGGLSLLANKVNSSYFSMLGPIFTWKFLLLVSILVGCVFIFRLFCRFICPLGALYGLFNRISIFGIRLESNKCIDCNKCLSACKMDIRRVGDAECISCGECIPHCPTGAISWKGGKILLKPNEGEKTASNDPMTADRHQKLKKITRLISAVCMIALLLGSFLFFWQQDASGGGNLDAQRGNQVGDLCYAYSLDVIDGSGNTGETIDPSATGKITVINFWGTWCTPCVGELPFFEQIADEYKDTVCVVAVHGMAANTAPAYIEKYYPDASICFAVDYIPEGGNAENGYYTTLGGRGTYPYTLVLDENGVITRIFFDSVTYEELKDAVEELL